RVVQTLDDRSTNIHGDIRGKGCSGLPYLGPSGVRWLRGQWHTEVLYQGPGSQPVSKPWIPACTKALDPSLIKALDPSLYQTHYKPWIPACTKPDPAAAAREPQLEPFDCSVLPGPDVQSRAKRVLQCKTAEDRSALQRDLRDWTSECGAPGICSATIGGLPKIYASVVKHYIFLR
ncbi:hypothetical protein KUCAC02_033337, partial [Chaenocephalus aceratus]